MVLVCYMCGEKVHHQNVANRDEWVCYSCGAVWRVGQWNTVLHPSRIAAPEPPAQAEGATGG